MRIPLKQRVVHKVGQLFQTSPFLIHSQQINNTCSSFLLLVEHIQALMGEFCFASVLCCENIAVTVWRPAWRAMKPLHSVVPTDLPEVSIIKWIDKHIQFISWWQKLVQGKLNILTNLILLMQFWVDDLYRLNVNLF